MTEIFITDMLKYCTTKRVPLTQREGRKRSEGSEGRKRRGEGDGLARGKKSEKREMAEDMLRSVMEGRV